MAFVLRHLIPGSSELRESGADHQHSVAEVTDGTVVRPDHLRDSAHTVMAIKEGVRLSARVLTHGQHLPIDHFFDPWRKIARPRHQRILCRTASDGTEGSRAIKGGAELTFAQDEQSGQVRRHAAERSLPVAWTSKASLPQSPTS